ncbi:MAG: hypothetical protein HY437_01645 [Candidatus Magasanikbacteria bacterium]|nr:hypothetical protein [Candidatus Magasanikbacteria bacterium]
MELKLVKRILSGLVGCLVIVTGVFIFLVGSRYISLTESFLRNTFLLLVFAGVIPLELKEFHLLFPTSFFFWAAGIYYIAGSIKGYVFNGITRASMWIFILFVFMLPLTYFLGDYVCQITPPDGFCMLFGIPPMLLGLGLLALWPIIFIIGVVSDIIRYRRRVK